ncbi:MAG: hypothetical protein QOE65_78 [Solirubrobacteraceae bacterium]|nr:hypothetical protein [Solirubrobacteraceae bacterium]
MNDDEAFREEGIRNAARMAESDELHDLSIRWINRSAEFKYTYNFRWLGLPVIQYPADIVALQEIVWEVKPDLIVETGVARGGSLVLYASLLELIGGPGQVVGVEINLRDPNRKAIEAHPLAKRISFVEGSSTSPEVLDQVAELAQRAERVMVVLDSNHTHEHVLDELKAYSPLVTLGSYLVVLDTVVADMPPEAFPDRPWGPDSNPRTAVREFLGTDDRFELDEAFARRLLISVAPDGYLRRVR